MSTVLDLGRLVIGETWGVTYDSTSTVVAGSRSGTLTKGTRGRGTVVVTGTRMESGEVRVGYGRWTSGEFGWFHTAVGFRTRVATRGG